MLSIRALARTIPKAFFRPSSAFRPLSTVTRPTFLQSAWKPAARLSYSAFSTSVSRREPAGDSDLELSEMIARELRYENESRDPNRVPPSVQDFLDNTSFTLEDIEGTQEVTLSKKFGEETIKVTFSVESLNSMEEESDQMDEDDDLALDDETLEDSMTTQKAKPAINQSGAKGNNIPVAPEDSVAPADRAETEAESAAGDVDMTPSFPSHLDVRVSKAGKGALQFNVIAQNGMVEIDEVFYFPDVELAESDSAEKLSKRNRLYSGPPYNNLDQDLQQMLERYLDERGINVQLATFVPDYIDFKEQREYLKWLENMKNFVDA